MPGVPTGRGCDACRKQKKKCNQARPSCSRCARLGIPCIGAGQRRYKFMEEKPSAVGHGTQMVIRTTSSSPRTSSPRSTSSVVSSPPRAGPSNQLSTVTTTFVLRLEVEDPRYSINCYGTFLASIPCRMGKSEVLDAAVTAMVVTLPVIHTHEPTWEAYNSYSHALKALRTSLETPTTAETSETLCAMYLIMITGAWLWRDGDMRASHGQAISHLLQVAAYQPWDTGPFENDLLATLCITAIMESLGNPRIQLEPWLSQLLKRYDLNREAMPFQSMRLESLGKIPTYLRQPTAHVDDMAQHYRELMSDLAKLRIGMDALAGASPSPPTTNIFSAVQTLYGFGLSMAICANAFLRIFFPVSSVLEMEWWSLYNDITMVGRQAMGFRPLGATYVPIMLTSVWSTTSDLNVKAEMEAQVNIYQPDFPGLRWMKYAVIFEDALEDTRRKVECWRDVNGIVADERITGAVYEDFHGLVMVHEGQPCCVV
ncbi:hypothetical protein GQ53DRAFT_664395 [Thozetella sp. PMI_491]|nr:hypothetical protein GQ53DRAFT_664395 [Thozetella sp. PMI_491]